jgi:hypothetical protein
MLWHSPAAMLKFKPFSGEKLRTPAWRGTASNVAREREAGQEVGGWTDGRGVRESEILPPNHHAGIVSKQRQKLQHEPCSASRCWFLCPKYSQIYLLASGISKNFLWVIPRTPEGRRRSEGIMESKILQYALLVRMLIVKMISVYWDDQTVMKKMF